MPQKIHLTRFAADLSARRAAEPPSGVVFLRAGFQSDHRSRNSRALSANVALYYAHFVVAQVLNIS
ncbi:hypothetical protein [Candidatus Pantoea deserta]|uniref:hypothetical protein n=1 Tax=Candidatus Pantoea deserta TaxID=1869313 RepID=UPI000F4FA978|nr:hypothetical protein [Pantoea deserta]